MASRTLFGSTKKNPLAPPTNTFNDAGGTAYQLSDEHALAQYAVTGALGGTFYACAETQLAKTLELAAKVSPRFLAQVAVYAREKGLMKDMPALLLAILSTRDIELTKAVFSRVCDDAKMVKNFVQIIRSGQVGRKSLGSALKRQVQTFLESRTSEQLFKAVVGSDPSLADVIRMVHPKPKNKARGNFYRYLIGKELTKAQFKTLPEEVQAYENFKTDPTGPVPEVPFMLLTNLKLNTAQYREVAENMSWSALRQNLNALSKHGVFKDKKAVKAAVEKLSDAELVRKAKAFPFQLFSAYQATLANTEVPREIANALQDAMDASLANIPEVDGEMVVAVDNSGSMSAAATGSRGSATSTVSCLDAAALMGSALLRRNPNQVELMAFNTAVYRGNFNGRDSVLTNANKLRQLPGGGTDCSCVLKDLNAKNAKGISTVIILSDNESWVDSQGQGVGGYYGGRRGTETMKQWNEFRKRNPKAKLVCIDIAPNGTAQTVDRPDILNVGGFSDSVFTVVDLFLKNDLTSSHWVGTIKKVEI
jgi:60 kDa SS-A/Ro ribonucleoprotein